MIRRVPRDSDRAPSRGFWFARDIPTVFWLLLTVAAVFASRAIPYPRWLIIHLLLLGAVTHAILVWSQYFSHALLHTTLTVAGRRHQNIRLALSNGGAILVFIGVPAGAWALSGTGAAALIVAVVWHGADIGRRLRTGMRGRFGGTVRYYIAAAIMLAIGSGLGGWLARGGSGTNLVLAHVLLNVLGWIGLAVAGTIVTLWPTILRTRAHATAARGSARALPCLAAGVLVAATGASLGSAQLVSLGLVGYLGGLVVIGVSLWRAARQAPPRSFAALSVGAALAWWAGGVAFLAAGSITAAIEGFGLAPLASVVWRAVPFLAAGFAAQVLVGALSYLVPVVLGGGPRPVRIGTAEFDRAGFSRVATANAALAVCAMPVPDTVSITASVVYVVAMGSFLVIMMRAMRAQRRAKAARGPTRGDRDARDGQSRGGDRP